MKNDALQVCFPGHSRNEEFVLGCWMNGWTTTWRSTPTSSPPWIWPAGTFLARLEMVKISVIWMRFDNHEICSIPESVFLEDFKVGFSPDISAHPPFPLLVFPLIIEKYHKESKVDGDFLFHNGHHSYHWTHRCSWIMYYLIAFIISPDCHAFNIQ